MKVIIHDTPHSRATMMVAWFITGNKRKAFHISAIAQLQAALRKAESDLKGCSDGC